MIDKDRGNDELQSKPYGLKLTGSSKSKKSKCGSIISGFLDYLQGGAEISLMTDIDVRIFFYICCRCFRFCVIYMHEFIVI